VIYGPSNTSFGHSAVTHGFSLTGGYIDGDVDDFVFFDPNEGDDVLVAFDGSHDAAGPDTANGQIDPAASFFFANDFVGSPTEEVDTLFAGFYLEAIDGFDADTSLDPNTVFVDVGVMMDAGTATLQYVYDDGIGAIPEPATASALFGLIALGGMITRRRR
tara:strand:- start:52842 stop:53324 length:483 start_codon:yes stop_codon:yes gene_type:complete